MSARVRIVRLWVRHVILVAFLSGCLGSPTPDGPEPEPAPFELVCRDPCDVPIQAAGPAAMEPTVVRNPADPQHLVAANAVYEADPSPVASIWIQTHVTRDGGRTWLDGRLAGGREAPPTHALAAYNVAGDPVLAFVDDRVLLAGIAAHGGGPAALPGGVVLADYALFVAVSSDGGATFPTARVVARGLGSYNDIYDKPSIATGSDGVVLLTWTHFHAVVAASPAEVVQADIEFSASRDGADTWAAPALVAPGHFQGSAPLVTDDTWFVAFEGTVAVDAEPQAPTPLWVASSTDAGAAWSVQQLGDTASGNYVSLKSGSRPGELFLAFAAPLGNGAVPAFLQSRDAGATWSDALILDPVVTQAKPLTALAVDDRGDAFFTWYHGAPGTATMEYRAGVVRLGVLPETLVVSQGLSPGFAQRDYAGLAGLDDGAFAVWVGGVAPATRVHAARIVFDAGPETSS